MVGYAWITVQSNRERRGHANPPYRLASSQHDQCIERHAARCAALWQRRERIDVNGLDHVRAIDGKLSQADQGIDDSSDVARLATTIALDQAGNAGALEHVAGLVAADGRRTESDIPGEL